MISVVIPTCHRNDLLAKCLDCLAPGRQADGAIAGIESEECPNPPAFTYEVIITDDGSKATAQDLVRHSHPWARWVAGPRKGPAANRNNGAVHARGEWLAFTDDDCLPDSDFLRGFWKAARETDAPVLEGRTSPTGTRTRVDMECPANETGGYLWSCNMAIRKDLFFELGGFDTTFPGPAMEDVDFRTRVIKAGKTIKFVPSARVFHPWRLKKGFAFWKLHSMSRVYFSTKHPETSDDLSLKSLGMALARKLIRQLPSTAFNCRGRGLSRELLLTFYATCSAIVYSKRIK